MVERTTPQICIPPFFLQIAVEGDVLHTLACRVQARRAVAIRALYLALRPLPHRLPRCLLLYTVQTLMSSKIPAPAFVVCRVFSLVVSSVTRDESTQRLCTVLTARTRSADSERILKIEASEVLYACRSPHT